MQNFQGTVFILKETYRDIFKSELVYLEYQKPNLTIPKLNSFKLSFDFA